MRMPADSAIRPAIVLRNLRRRAGLSMTQLAKEAGYKGASSIQRYEDDHQFGEGRLPRDFIEKIAPVLIGRGVTAADVYALADLEPPSTTPQSSRPKLAAHGEEWKNPPIEQVLPQAVPVAFGPRDLPIYGAAESLNLATAAAAVLYEAVRQRSRRA